MLNAWSPASDRLAFASNRGGSFDVYIMKSDGSRVTRVTDNLAHDADPAWGIARGGNDN